MTLFLCTGTIGLPRAALAQAASADRTPACRTLTPPQASTSRAARGSRRSAISAAPDAGPLPVAYDIRLDPDFSTGVLRERARVVIRNPQRSDSLELALNDWFDSVAVSAATARATVRRGQGSVVVRLTPAHATETLCFDLSGRPTTSGDEHRSVIGRESLFLLWSDAFYPLDYYAWAPVHLSIALPPAFRVFGPGHETRAELAWKAAGAADDVVVHTFTSDHPLRLFSVLADRRWIETRRTIGGVALRTLLYPAMQQYADSLLRRSADVLSVYARLFGPYSFDEFTFITLDSLYARRALAGGVAYSPAYLEREMSRTGYDGHETALLWWGYTTTGRGPGAFQWTEGLGDYAEYLYDEERDKPLPPIWSRFRAAYLALPADAEPPISALRGNTPQAIVHGKYPWLLHLLRFDLGDDAFLRAMRQLFERYRFRAFTLDEMVRSLEASSGRSLAWWQHGWLLRPAVPEVRFTADAEPDGEHWRIVARLEQTTSPFSFPAEIGVFSAGTRRLERIRVDSAAQTFTLSSRVRPDSVTLDPRGWVIMRRRSAAAEAARSGSRRPLR